MEDVPQEESTKAPTEPKTSENKQAGNSEEVIDRLQSKVQQYVRGADQTMLEQMRLTVFEVVVGILRSKEFQGDIPKAVETACKAAGPLLKEISKSKPAAQEEMYEDPMELDVSTPRSTSLMNQAAEGMRALGSFFAQAAMGGAEVSTLVREEEEAYHAEDIVYPLRRLAANEPGLDDSLIRQSSMYAGSSLAGLSPEGSIDLTDRGEDGGTTATSRGPLAQGGDPTLMGGHTGPTVQGAEFARDAQGRAKEGREAQQRQLAAQTGDTLYPASGDATVKVTATFPQQRSTYDVKEDDGRDGGTFASARTEAAPAAANTEHITSQPAETRLQEENWDDPARQATTAPTGEPNDVKGSQGHGDAKLPHES